MLLYPALIEPNLCGVLMITSEQNISIKDDSASSQQNTIKCEPLPVRARPKKEPRIILPDTQTESNVTNEALEHQVNELVVPFHQIAFDIEHIPPFTIETRVTDDFILRQLIPEYQKIKAESHHEIKFTRKRVEDCLNQKGYLVDLARLLQNTIDKLQNNKSKMEELKHEMSSRITLISPSQLDQEMLTAVKKELILSLELFLLAFFVIELKDKTNPNTSFFVEQLALFIQEVTELFCKKDTGLNPDGIKLLTATLRQHIGITSRFERWFGKNSIKQLEVNELINGLFHPGPTFTLSKDQLANLYDLMARITAFPITKIKNYDALISSEYIQKNQLCKQQAELKTTLNTLSNYIQSELKLFSGSSLVDTFEVRTARSDLSSLTTINSELELLITNYNKQLRDTNEINNPLQKLDALTFMQHQIIDQLQKQQQLIEKKKPTIHHTVQQLKQKYSFERELYIIQLNDALNEANAALQTQNKNDQPRSMQLAKDFLASLLKTEHKITLSSIKYKAGTHLNSARRNVQEVKKELRTQWICDLSDLFSAPQIGTECSATMMSENLLEHIKKQKNTSYIPKLSPINPLYQQALSVAQSYDNLSTTLIEHFSDLDRISGQQISTWMKEVSAQFQTVSTKAAEKKAVLAKAHLIEQRLQSNAYKTSCSIMNTIEAEFIRIIQKHLDVEMIQNKEFEQQLHSLKDNPGAYLQTQQPSIQNKQILNQVDLRLAKLFDMSKEFKQLNRQFINTNPSLIDDNQYVNQLFRIIQNKLQNDSMEQLSKRCSKKSDFLFWLRTYVLKPLLHYQQKAKEHLNPYVQSWLNQTEQSRAEPFKPKFFKPTVITPFAGTTEKKLICTGQNALINLEAKYLNQLAITA